MGLLDNMFRHSVDKKNKKYAIIPDGDAISCELSSFRNHFNNFFGSQGIQENGELQKYVTQSLWHILYLQKKKMDRLGITMNIKCDRRKYDVTNTRGIREDKFNDGKYDINNVFEEITATNTFYQNGKEIGFFEFDEVAHYLFFSAKTVGNNKMLCVNCGAESTRENLIDGCDYCGTKYTIEDLEGRIGYFAFKNNYWVKWYKYGPSVAEKGGVNKYETIKQLDTKYGDEIREKDTYFSLQELYVNLNNKLTAIHLAEDPSQINEFSDVDLKAVLDEYRDVIYMEMVDIHLNNYEVRGTFQYAQVSCHMNLYELKDGKIEKRTEVVALKLMKVERRKTQEVSAPKLMKCRGCGNSVTLLDGKICPICGRQIDLIQYDWVIVEYKNWK